MQLTVPCLAILVGPSAAGKSTWASQHFEANEVVASDALRAVAGIDDADQQASTDAFFLLDEIVRRRLTRKLTTVVDTLGFDADRRAAHAALAREVGLPVYVIGFDTPPDVCRQRNAAKTRPIPQSVIAKQLSSWRKVRPILESEGYDGVWLVSGEGSEPTVVSTPMATAAAAVERHEASPQGLEFGLQISSFTWPDDGVAVTDRLGAIATAAEAAGFSSLWVMDHFRQIPQLGRAWEPMPECYTTLSYLAGITERVRLGALVTGITYRDPVLLGKMLATLDVLSGGRAICGLGVGWFEAEAKAYGWEWPATRERYLMLEDTLQMLPKLWGPGSQAFQGEVLSVPETMCYPRPMQDPIPILVGGSGEKKTLRLVAQYADFCNLFGDPATVANKVEVLNRHCAEVGRSRDDVTVSHLTTALVGSDRSQVADLVARYRPQNQAPAAYAASVNAGTVADHIGRFREYAEAGVGYSMVSLPNVHDPEAIGRFGEIIGSFRTG